MWTFPVRAVAVVHDDRRVCPYCEGKGFISVEVEVAIDEPDRIGNTKTWSRQDCPLCGGTGNLYGDPVPNPF